MLADYREVWVLDFEFYGGEGENPHVVCMSAQEIKTGRILNRWHDQLERPPFDLGENTLFVAFYSSAEWNCFRALGWSLPARTVDLYVEFRNLTNNLMVPSGSGLLGALAFHGLGGITSDEKTSMRDLILTGGPWDESECIAIMKYCYTDVDATVRLLKCMAPRLDWPRAELRGQYMQAVSSMETEGVPIDVYRLDQLRTGLEGLQHALITEVDKDYGVYQDFHFRNNLFERYLVKNNIAWPRLESGNLMLDDGTFKEQGHSYPQLNSLRELRTTQSRLRLHNLAVGPDGRNRALLSPFRARTGRNQPSNAKFVFGPATWVRHLIKPLEGYGLAYVDWGQQEFAIAASLSGDPAMMAAYQSGDPYLEFAKQAGAIPQAATKETHQAERDRFKACVLGVQYGMGEQSLAARINQDPVYARRLLEAHRNAYPRFWEWSDGVENCALLHCKLHTAFGWVQHYGSGAVKINTRSIRNYPMQGNGAEMLRLACIFATEGGVKVCAPVHDAILIEAPIERLEDDVARMREFMRCASALVLDGFEVQTDAELVRFPDRYSDARGKKMWDTIIRLLDAKPVKV